jgi:glutaredoxin
MRKNGKINLPFLFIENHEVHNFSMKSDRIKIQLSRGSRCVYGYCVKSQTQDFEKSVFIEEKTLKAHSFIQLYRWSYL